VYLKLVLKVAVQKQPKVSVVSLTTIYRCKYLSVQYRTENDRLERELVRLQEQTAAAD
jgi:hypothetical protein